MLARPLLCLGLCMTIRAKPPNVRSTKSATQSKQGRLPESLPLASCVVFYWQYWARAERACDVRTEIYCKQPWSPPLPSTSMRSLAEISLALRLVLPSDSK